MAEIARKMGVKPQQLYPIARRLSGDGTIAKRNGSYIVSGGARKASKASKAAAARRTKARK